MKLNLDTNSERLLGAAELLLKAIGSHDGMNTLVPVYSGISLADASLSNSCFTLMELVEAMTLLVHLGFVPGPLGNRADTQVGSHDSHPMNHAFPMHSNETHRFDSSASRLA